ncbi:hypothetical protein P167DRAFT_532519 [Morchella conica CCBAS932]|uniref:Uncharacterized protein n=1 Tax=Morchella conica CCBAS932 TaxID=1392247 RepID=A0A3N4KZR5_9PEZI|nr:hypothetical protein P167DRAFT_532519 [Morchella conica CCBAS932]
MPNPTSGRRTGEADIAAMEAAKGAVNGAARWGAVSVVAGVIAYFTSPLFRGLTPQFKVYLWMCPTTIGSMVEADRRLRIYENMVRHERREQLEAAHEKQMLDEMAELEILENRAKKSP